MAQLNNSSPDNEIKDLTAKYETSSVDIDNELAALKQSLGK
jgi:phage shock protein A